MRLVTYKLIVGLTLIAIGCSHNPKTVLNDTFPTIHIEPKIDIENCNLSEIAKKIEIVSLETNPNSIISSMSNLVFLDKNNIIYRSDKTVIIFDGEGNYIGKVNAVGNGPEEYNSITTVDFDPNNKWIYIVDGSDIKVYNFDGEFIKKIKIPFRIGGLFKAKNRFVIPVVQRYAEKNRDMLHILDSNLTKIKSFKSRNNDDYSKAKQMYSFMSNPYVVKNELYFREYFTDTIFRVVDTTLVPYWSITLGKYRKKIRNSLNSDDFLSSLLNKKISSFGVLESINYFFISYYYGSGLYKSVFDKKKREFVFHKRFTENDMFIGIKNDLIPNAPLFNPKFIKNNLLVSIIYPVLLNNEQLEQFNCKIDDNPLLFIVTTNN